MDFDGSAIEGFARVQEADMVAKPDPGTFQVLPGPSRDGGVARMFCDVLTPEGEPFDGDPRGVLRRNLERAAGSGFTFRADSAREIRQGRTCRLSAPTRR